MEAKTIESNVPCHICYAQKLDLMPNYPSLPRVASDCVPWRSGGSLAICPNCQCVQNPVDDNWHNEITKIYSRYKLYRQSAGNEQGVLSENKQLKPRSAKIFDQLKSYCDFKKEGRLLDIGCANGELLRCFSTIAPHWKMTGFEIDDKCREEVESIPGVEAFASGSLTHLTQAYDIITIVHVLEHLPNPRLWLQDLKRILKPDGFVVVQVPDPKLNPYNLLVADHCSHFIMSDLISIAEKAGYEVVAHSDQWVLREFSLLIRPKAESEAQIAVTLPNDKIHAYPQKSLDWLHSIVELAKAFPQGKARGIWGTAIAATWVYSLMDCQIDFFVDEDPSRVGKQHLDKPIYSPDKIPAESNIFIALTPELAQTIANRWSHLNATLHTPPNLIY